MYRLCSAPMFLIREPLPWDLSPIEHNRFANSTHVHANNNGRPVATHGNCAPGHFLIEPRAPAKGEILLRSMIVLSEECMREWLKYAARVPDTEVQNSKFNSLACWLHGNYALGHFLIESGAPCEEWNITAEHDSTKWRLYERMIKILSTCTWYWSSK